MPRLLKTRAIKVLLLLLAGILILVLLGVHLRASRHPFDRLTRQVQIIGASLSNGDASRASRVIESLKENIDRGEAFAHDAGPNEILVLSKAFDSRHIENLLKSYDEFDRLLTQHKTRFPLVDFDSASQKFISKIALLFIEPAAAEEISVNFRAEAPVSIEEIFRRAEMATAIEEGALKAGHEDNLVGLDIRIF